MNPLSGCDIVTVWERAYGQVPFEKAMVLLGFAIPNASPEDLRRIPVAERDAILLELRERTLGSLLKAFAVCPRCREELEFSLETPALKEQLGAPAGTSETEIEEYTFVLRRPSSADLVTLPTGADLSAARLALAARCIQEARRDGQPVDAREIPGAALEKLADRVAELEETSEVQIGLCCPACAHSWQLGFDIASYFTAELAVLAQHLLEEVHVLASAYGWSEREILTIPATRRRFYLERVR